jgi:hypothetical protein
MEKHLFLDFDGVLNTDRYAKRLKKEGIDPFDEFGAMFDPNTISNLRSIVEQTDCKIVLSSTWRNEGMMRMRALWENRNLPGKLFLMTPILLSTTYNDARNGELFTIPERNSKALEIQAWLQRNAKEPFEYVIIDDENVFFYSQQEHLVQTDEYDGLTLKKAQEAISVLDGNATKRDIACVNKYETEIFPYPDFTITMKGADHYTRPCIYIESLSEDYCIQASLDGFITKVIRCEKGKTEIIKNVEEQLKEWLMKWSKDPNANGKHNFGWLVHVWEIIH